MLRPAALVFIGCGVLAGCGALRGLDGQEPVPWVQAGSPQPATDAESLLLYYQYVRKLSSAELGREHDAARQALSRSRSEWSFTLPSCSVKPRDGTCGRVRCFRSNCSHNPSLCPVAFSWH